MGHLADLDCSGAHGVVHGVLLAEGIGDTLRVSLTGDTVDEVKAGYEMLKALNLRQHGPVIVSCPSCGRCDVDLIESTQKVESSLERLQKEAAAALPDVVLVDGGLPQLQAANDVMVTLKLEEITLIGVSKGPGRKPGFETLHRLSHAPWHLPGDSMALHFIQQIRDEAHRFAITGHRLRRDKTRRVSVLQDIPGIGAKRRRELLRYFGGIQGIAHASLGELLKVPGINRSLAERIFVSLHDTNS